MNYHSFVEEQIAEIRKEVGEGTAINALSGGVDSSVVTALGFRALGFRLKTVFIDSALMREGEPDRVVKTFADIGIPVQKIDARADFLKALKGLTDPEEKRNAVTFTFYKTVFGRLVRETGARSLLHGTILTDIEETVAGIKRQHNILAQLGEDVVLAFDPGNGFFNVREDCAVEKTPGPGFADKPAEHGFVKRKGDGVSLFFRVGQPLERL